MTTERERAEWQRLHRETGDRAWAILRQPWRIIRNRRLRREIAGLRAEGDNLYSAQTGR